MHRFKKKIILYSNKLYFEIQFIIVFEIANLFHYTEKHNFYNLK